MLTDDEGMGFLLLMDKWMDEWMDGSAGWQGRAGQGRQVNLTYLLTSSFYTPFFCTS